MAPFFLGLLVFLFALWAVMLFGGFIAGPPPVLGERRMARWTRLGSSLMLVLAGWMLTLVLGGTDLGVYTRLIAIGMTLGLAGDLFMARALPSRNPVLTGIAAFALCHVAYIVAGLRLAVILDLTASAPRLAAWLAWLLLGAATWYLLIFRGQKPSILHWASLPYALLLASTAGVATGLALQEGALAALALGAALFLFSDLMIAAKLFAGLSFRHIAMDDLIWLTYGPGQMLIVYTTVLLLRRL